MQILAYLLAGLSISTAVIRIKLTITIDYGGRSFTIVRLRSAEIGARVWYIVWTKRCRSHHGKGN
jgi:hypothetical protein